MMREVIILGHSHRDSMLISLELSDISVSSHLKLSMYVPNLMNRYSKLFFYLETLGASEYIYTKKQKLR